MGEASRGGPRVVRRWRSHSGIAAVIALVAAQPACGLITSDGGLDQEPGTETGLPAPVDAGLTAGDAADGAEAADAVGLDVSEAGQSDVLPHCTAAIENPVLASEAIPFPTGRPRIFYSWTTEEQIAELRAGGELFSRSEREGLGRGYAFTALAEFAAAGSTGLAGDLARLLGEYLFINIRYAWTNPWATRLGWPGEDYGNQLVQIVLDPAAWIVVFDGYQLQVLDGNDEVVPIEDALAQPERIGALYFLRGEGAGGPLCGTFLAGDGGYREFVLGNVAMVEQWSIGTDAILAQLDADIGALEAMIELLSDCSLEANYNDWNAEIVCHWEYRESTSPGRIYEDALALPSASYVPTAENLQALVDTLRADRFEPDPLVVHPNEPP